MSIEIKEITIKADVYPASSPADVVNSITERDLERMKRDIIKEVTQAIIEKINQTIER